MHAKAKSVSAECGWWVGVSDTTTEGSFHYDSSGKITPFTEVI